MQTARLILAFINVFLPVVTAACSACEEVALTWNGAQLQTNKLSTSEIRYTNVGTFEGRRLDLVVKKLDPNTNVDCSGNGDACKGLKVPHYGGVGIRRGNSKVMLLCHLHRPPTPSVYPC